MHVRARMCPQTIQMRRSAGADVAVRCRMTMVVETKEAS